MIKRILSAIIAIIYLSVAYLGGGSEGAIRCALFLFLPMACIWFSEEMGSFTGVMRGHYINAETPGCLVALGGWFVLMLPFIIWIIEHFSAK
ncbi:MAG TPA: hypothetical protein PKH07_17230 [bacterium]|nr:hypothetical protein [bacterium]